MLLRSLLPAISNRHWNQTIRPRVGFYLSSKSIRAAPESVGFLAATAYANYNVHSFNLSMQIPWFYSFLQSSEIAHCGSVGILKATEWMGLKLPLQYRASYTLLMPKLPEHCDRQEFSIFLLGAKPEHSQRVSEKIV
jgi:UDP-N-acetyl-D-mannosaminuronic acid transferase (WecB/TagA/CpsF family)